MTYWQRWIWQPQTVWLRKAIFQLHLWSGIGIGLYVLLVSVTGSILVYRNELYRAATRDPIVVTESGPRLTDEQLKGAATRAYPGYTVVSISRARNPDQAVSISLESGAKLKDRLFNPYTGAGSGRFGAARHPAGFQAHRVTRRSARRDNGPHGQRRRRAPG